MISLFSITALLGLALSTSNIFAQANYYVATDGSNGADGSEASPWLTVQYGIDQLTAGDTLNIKAGTYAGKIDCNVSGTTSQQITIRNYNNDIAMIDGAGLNDYEYLLEIDDQDYITIEGLRFGNYQKLDAIGIRVINSSGITIRNNAFFDIDYANNALGLTPNETQNSQPIIVFGRDANSPITDLVIEGNSIYNCEVGYSECLSVNGNVDGFEIIDNHIYDNTNIGIVAIGHEGECLNPAVDQARNGVIAHNLVHDNPSAYAAAAGVYIDGAKSVVVNNNISYNNDYGIEVGCENNGAAPNDPSASDITVINNTLYNNGVTGIAFGGYNYPVSGKVETTEIRNNTLYGNDTQNTYSGEMYISYVENSTIENNIFSSTNVDKVLYIVEADNPTLTFDYNLYYCPTGENDMTIEVNGTGYYEWSTYQANSGQDANSDFADPLLVDTDVTNFDGHLDSTSPAIDNGNPSTGLILDEVDLDGENRISTTIDIGADEYYTTTGIHVYAQLDDICIYPNPFQDIVNVAGDLQNFEIGVYDSLGNLVDDYTGSTSPLTIDLSTLGTGLYFLSLQHVNFSDQSVYTIIKE